MQAKNTRILITVYEHENHISLDPIWIENVSGGKAESVKRQALVTEDTYEALAQANNKRFNYEYYNQLLGCDLQSVASTYMETLRKDVSLEMDDNHLLSDAEELSEIIEYDFNGELQIIRKEGE